MELRSRAGLMKSATAPEQEASVSISHESLPDPSCSIVELQGITIPSTSVISGQNSNSVENRNSGGSEVTTNANTLRNNTLFFSDNSYTQGATALCNKTDSSSFNSVISNADKQNSNDNRMIKDNYTHGNAQGASHFGSGDMLYSQNSLLSGCTVQKPVAKGATVPANLFHRTGSQQNSIWSQATVQRHRAQGANVLPSVFQQTDAHDNYAENTRVVPALDQAMINAIPSDIAPELGQNSLGFSAHLGNNLHSQGGSPLADHGASSKLPQGSYMMANDKNPRSNFHEYQGKQLGFSQKQNFGHDGSNGFRQHVSLGGQGCTEGNVPSNIQDSGDFVAIVDRQDVYDSGMLRDNVASSHAQHTGITSGEFPHSRRSDFMGAAPSSSFNALGRQQGFPLNGYSGRNNSYQRNGSMIDRDHIQNSNDRSNGNEYKPRLPFYNGKSPYEAFWVQFQMFVRKYNWSTAQQCEFLILCLKEDALVYASQLSWEVRNNIWAFEAAMKRRFGDHVLPEIHRANLQTMRKQPKESTEEFAARISNLMIKAYPGLNETQLFREMSVEYLVQGLGDPSLAYDVMSKKPQSVDAAMEMIRWHECCRNGAKRKPVVRQVASRDFDDSDGDSDHEDQDTTNVRRVNGKRFVTEETLQQFGKELKDSIVESIKDVVQKQNSSSKPGFKGSNEPRPRNTRRSDQAWKQKVECYNCHKTGHISRECPDKQSGSSGNTKPADSVKNETNELN